MEAYGGVPTGYAECRHHTVAAFGKCFSSTQISTQRGAYRSKRPRPSTQNGAVLNCPGLPPRTCRRPRMAVPNRTNSGGGGPSG